jgi:hypothetical protein
MDVEAILLQVTVWGMFYSLDFLPLQQFDFAWRILNTVLCGFRATHRSVQYSPVGKYG